MRKLDDNIKSYGQNDDDPLGTNAIKRLAKRGALWVTLTSAAAVPLAYYRNWILARIGDSGVVVGNYAILLLFIQIVVTFALFGGSSVVTNFLPKIKRDEDKSAFLVTYVLISVVAVTVFVVLMNLFPGMASFLIRKQIDPGTLQALSFLAPIIVLAQMAVFSLAGLMEFRFSSVLNQLQLFFICILATSAFFMFPELIQDRSAFIFTLAVAAANLTVLVIGSTKVIKSVSMFSIRLFLPLGFWRFAGFVHLNTISTFAYLSIDQLFILTTLGTKELGAYFVLSQCAQLITFIPQRVGQVMLASFSYLVANEEKVELGKAYVKLCRVILNISTPLALMMVLFSHPVARIFGDWYAERHFYLLFLAAAVHIGALGSVNGMLIMAKERTGLFLANSLTLISMQLAVTYVLLDVYGVYAVIAGKAVGIVIGQIGLFSIVRLALDDIRLSPPREYWIAMIIVLIAAALSFLGEPLTPILAVIFFILLLLIFLFLIRFKVQEVLTLFTKGRG